MRVADKIIGAGGQAYIVGGAVRELLLGIPPAEFDIATDLEANLLKRLFPDAKPVFPPDYLVFVFSREGYKFEVARMRRDYDYSGRHSKVEFTSEIEEDLQRRDFTVNALAYDPKEDRIIDLFEGRKDIERRIIRSIGNPLVRFEEDKLRMLRAIRFAARLNFRLSEDVEEAIKSLSSAVVSISKELVRKELVRMLEHNSAPRALGLLHRTNLFQKIFSARLNRKALVTAVRSLHYLVRSKADLTLRLAAVLYWSRTVPDEVHLSFTRAERRLLNWLLASSDPFLRFLAGEELPEIVRIVDAPAFPLFLTFLESLFYAEWKETEFLRERVKVRLPGYGLPSLLMGEELPCPPKQRGKYLRKIRYLQLRGKIRTKEEALSHLSLL